MLSNGNILVADVDLHCIAELAGPRWSPIKVVHCDPEWRLAELNEVPLEYAIGSRAVWPQIPGETWASNMTPPSEVIRPPSNAAVTFLRSTAGNENGSRLSSIIAGVAASNAGAEWL
jgi:hypothetical protein